MTTSSREWGGGPESMEILLERYIDGNLAGDELALMEQHLHQNPALREEIELQGRIDDSLRRTHAIDLVPMPPIPIGIAPEIAPIREPSFTPAVSPSAATTAHADTAPPAPLAFPWRRWSILAAAAAILLAAAGFFRSYWDTRVPDFKLVQPLAMYDRLVATGFTPAIICKTEPEFARLVKEKLGTALIATATPGIEVLGWGYQDDYDGSPISPKTMMLLTKVDGREVLVLLDRASRDRTLKLPEGSDKRLFRREIGPLVTYEITPFPEQRVLPTLREP